MRERRPSTPDDPLFEYQDLEEFSLSKELPTGRFSIPYNGIPVDFSYHPVDGADTTVVCFHGAILTTVHLPWLPGQRIMEPVNANRFAVSDPTLSFSNDLKLSWYIGSEKHPGLQDFISKVIRQASKITGIKHLVFFGGSGGGYAALEMSRRFQGSLALPMNPQITISRYARGSVQRFLRAGWPSVADISELPETAVHDLVNAYSETPSNTIGYVQNTRDETHIQKHQLPFFEKVGDSSKVWTYMHAWGDPAKTGHVTPPKDHVSELLQAVTSVSGDWPAGLAKAGFVQQASRAALEARVQESNSSYVYVRPTAKKKS